MATLHPADLNPTDAEDDGFQIQFEEESTIPTPKVHAQQKSHQNSVDSHFDTATRGDLAVNNFQSNHYEDSVSSSKDTQSSSSSATEAVNEHFNSAHQPNGFHDTEDGDTQDDFAMSFDTSQDQQDYSDQSTNLPPIQEIDHEKAGNQMVHDDQVPLPNQSIGVKLPDLYPVPESPTTSRANFKLLESSPSLLPRNAMHSAPPREDNSPTSPNSRSNLAIQSNSRSQSGYASPSSTNQFRQNSPGKPSIVSRWTSRPTSMEISTNRSYDARLEMQQANPNRASVSKLASLFSSAQKPQRPSSYWTAQHISPFALDSASPSLEDEQHHNHIRAANPKYEISASHPLPTVLEPTPEPNISPLIPDSTPIIEVHNDDQALQPVVEPVVEPVLEPVVESVAEPVVIQPTPEKVPHEVLFQEDQPGDDSELELNEPQDRPVSVDLEIVDAQEKSTALQLDSLHPVTNDHVSGTGFQSALASPRVYHRQESMTPSDEQSGGYLSNYYRSDSRPIPPISPRDMAPPQDVPPIPPIDSRYSPLEEEIIDESPSQEGEDALSVTSEELTMEFEIEQENPSENSHPRSELKTGIVVPHINSKVALESAVINPLWHTAVTPHADFIGPDQHIRETSRSQQPPPSGQSTSRNILHLRPRVTKEDTTAEEEQCQTEYQDIPKLPDIYLQPNTAVIAYSFPKRTFEPQIIERQAIGNPEFVELGKFMTDDDIVHLQPTLTELDIPNASLLTGRCISKLPATLTWLNLGRNCLIDGGALCFLPPTLQRLEAPNCNSVNDHTIQSLPKQLTHLNLASSSWLTDACVKNLPRGLIFLKLYASKETFTCKKFFHLPGSLTTLRLERLGKVTKKATRQLPQTLTRIDFPHVTEMRDKCFKYLPPGLTHLDVRSVQNVNILGISSMPPALTFLKIEGNLKWTDNLATHLPQTLLILGLNPASGRIQQNMNIPAGAGVSSAPLLTTACLSSLPKSLTILDIEASVNHNVSLSKFPERLTCLRFASPSPISSPFLDALPPNLLLLHLYDSPNAKFDDSDVPKLPRSLTWLSIRADRLTSACVPHLPPNIRYMNMIDIPTVSFDALPNTIEWLTLPPETGNRRFLANICDSLPNWPHSNMISSLDKFAFGDFDQYDIENWNTIGSPLRCPGDPNLFLGANRGTVDQILSLDAASYPSEADMLEDPLYLKTAIPYQELGILEHLTPQYGNQWLLPSYSNLRDAPRLGAYERADSSLTPFDLHLHMRRFAKHEIAIQNFRFNTASPLAADGGASLSDSTVAQHITEILTFNELYAPANTQLTKAGFKLLPQTFTALNLRQNESIKPDALKYLPASLIYIDLELSHRYEDSSFKKVPNKLTWLDLGRSHKISGSFLSKLPDSMVGLSIGTRSIKNKNLGDLQRMTRLQMLELGNMKKFTPIGAGFLPANLTHLDLFSVSNMTDDVSIHLPRQLRYLNIHCNASVTDVFLIGLPRSLTYLDMTHNPNITDKGMEGLPRGLLHFELQKSKISIKGIAALPPQLKFLNMVADKSTERYENFLYMPRYLLYLGYQGLAQSHYMKCLPQSLTCLNMPAISALSEASIRHLPSSIIWLDLHDLTHSKNGTPFDLTLAMWPPHLALLNIFCMNTNNLVSNNIIPPTIPMSMRHIVTKNSAFTSLLAKSLPLWENDAEKVTKSIFCPGMEY